MNYISFLDCELTENISSNEHSTTSTLFMIGAIVCAALLITIIRKYKMKNSKNKKVVENTSSTDSNTEHQVSEENNETPLNRTEMTNISKPNEEQSYQDENSEETIKLKEEERKKEIEKKRDYLIQDIESFLKTDDFASAEKIIPELEVLIKELGDETKISKVKSCIDNAKQKYGLLEGFGIKTANCSDSSGKSQPFFNIPKKEGKGEDADPYVNVKDNRNWGVISVFDGMGGAGARKYIHKDTKEEGTSAYWASRFVSSIVGKTIEKVPSSHELVEFLDSNLKNDIVSNLNERIKVFPAAEAPLMSKMMRKLPTTMALCAYKISESKDSITVDCFWAGDSRIYLFKPNGLVFLTKDDADAPDGDPFSPANSDLIMNNSISQDRDFRINHSTLKIEANEFPIALIAATDGCFGYFKNPIEFEYVIRKSLSESSKFNDWMPKVKEAIIENIQQDDFSMATVALGFSNFESFKNQMTNHLANNKIFGEYKAWKEQNNNKIKTITEKIEKLKSDISAERKNVNTLNENLKEVNNQKDSIEIFHNRKEYADLQKDYEALENGFNADKEECNKKIAEANSKKSSLEVKNENLRFEIDFKNNEWYEQYKSIVSFVEQDAFTK